MAAPDTQTHLPIREADFHPSSPASELSKGRWTAILECERAFTLLEELAGLCRSLPQPDSLTFAESLIALHKKARETEAFFSQLEYGPYPSGQSQCPKTDREERTDRSGGSA